MTPSPGLSKRLLNNCLRFAFEFMVVTSTHKGSLSQGMIILLCTSSTYVKLRWLFSIYCRV